MTETQIKIKYMEIKRRGRNKTAGEWSHTGKTSLEIYNTQHRRRDMNQRSFFLLLHNLIFFFFKCFRMNLCYFGSLCPIWCPLLEQPPLSGEVVRRGSEWIAVWLWIWSGLRFSCPFTRDSWVYGGGCG